MKTIEEISQAVLQLEKKRDIRILYACEAGSRAWHIASPDSDYDVRFVYCKDINWYLNLVPQTDTMEWFAEDRLMDFSGWDLRKTLLQFFKCNPSFNEQINSPIVYHSCPAFHEAMKSLLPLYFNPIKTIYHYSALAKNQWDTFGGETEMKVKKFFYVVRPLLCCCWVDEYESMPPTEFEKLIDLQLFDKPENAGLKDQLLELVNKKQSMIEGELLSITGWAKSFIERLFVQTKILWEDSQNRFAKNMPHTSIDALNQLFIDLIADK